MFSSKCWRCLFLLCLKDTKKIRLLLDLKVGFRITHHNYKLLKKKIKYNCHLFSVNLVHFLSLKGLEWPDHRDSIRSQSQCVYKRYVQWKAIQQCLVVLLLFETKCIFTAQFWLINNFRFYLTTIEYSAELVGSCI